MNLIELKEFAVSRGGSVNPAKYKEEFFDLYSISAYDNYKPEIQPGSAIGSAKKVVQTNDVLLSRIVPHIRRVWVVGPKVERRQIASGEWIIYRGDYFFPNYLRHVLMTDHFHQQFMQTVSGVGGSLLRARPAEVEKIKIPLPSLPEQKRIAAILDKADAIRRKRQQAIKLADDFLRATFLDMFGDPITNPKWWPITALESVCVSKQGIKAGPFGSALKKEVYTSSGYRVYGQEQVIGGDFSIGDYYIDEEKYDEMFVYAVQPGDLLISLVGSIGNTIVAPEHIEPGIINPRLLRIRTKKEKLNPVFLQYLLKQPNTQAELAKYSHGGTMPVLNGSMLKEFNIIVPPVKKQNDFSEFARRHRKTADKLIGSFNSLKDLFNSLTQRAFRGEL